MDLYKHQSLAHLLINVLKHSATLQEDVSYNLLFALLNQEEHVPNVMQTLESAKLLFQTVMTTILAPTMHTFQGLDVPTLLNVSPQTCA